MGLSWAAPRDVLRRQNRGWRPPSPDGACARNRARRFRELAPDHGRHQRAGESSFAQGYSPTNFPLRSTVMRSQISYTWSRKVRDEQYRDRPCRAIGGSGPNSASTSVPRPGSRVGSSENQHGARRSTRAARPRPASCCRAAGRPPAICVTSSSMPRPANQLGAARGARSRASRLPWPRLHGRRGYRPAQIFFREPRGSAADGFSLVNGAYAELLRLQWRTGSDRPGRSSSSMLPASGAWTAGEHLDQRGLAGAVLAHEGVHFNRHASVSSTPASACTPGEGAGDVACPQHDLGGRSWWTQYLRDWDVLLRGFSIGKDLLVDHDAPRDRPAGHHPR